ncbi:MAG TPA: hypothetical protein PLT82_05950 [Candidatus Hydrogenedens sp.]|nr:hypothetical protein [Candidatus Hydrogenedens sp.]
MLIFLCFTSFLLTQHDVINPNSQTNKYYDFRTCFQTSQSFNPMTDIGSDVAIVYGTSENLGERIESWKHEGYRVAYMTGISWGNYGSYYLTDQGLKKEEIQTDKTGKIWMHGNSKTVGYNVPTDNYVEYIKQVLVPPLNYKVESIYLEEPEFWAVTGWSDAFKNLWEKHYGEPWKPPNESIDTQYKASLLKYKLYSNALTEVFQFAKRYSKEHNFDLGCYVPTHSLINYAQWRIVSPESMLTSMDNCDGIIAQVWTGTARTRHYYQGVSKERTFETAYLEYAQMVGMVLPAKKHLIFLADPIEDNPNYDWDDYRFNYESTVLASLFFPEVSTFEVMPWPERIFMGKYSKSKEDKETKINIIPEYGSELLAVITALNDMKQSDIEWVSKNYPIGVMVSDTLMFQRAEPNPSNPQLNNFFGITTPLIKNGIPVKIVQMEHLITYNPLEDIKLLILTYEGQKPLNKEYHSKIKDWIYNGGGLLIIDDKSDPYNDLNMWWKSEGFQSPIDHLIKICGIDNETMKKPITIGKGYLWWIRESPTLLSREKSGCEIILNWVKDMASLLNMEIEYKNYMHLRRGLYHICSVQDESLITSSYTVNGTFINLFNPALRVEKDITLSPNQRALLYDLNYALKRLQQPDILLSAGRIREKIVNKDSIRFTIRGAKNIPGKVLIYSDKVPTSIKTKEPLEFESRYDEENKIVYLNFIHQGSDICFEIYMS